MAPTRDDGSEGRRDWVLTCAVGIGVLLAVVLLLLFFDDYTDEPPTQRGVVHDQP